MSRCSPVMMLVAVMLIVTLLTGPAAFSAGRDQEGSSATSPAPGPTGDPGTGWISDRFVSDGHALDIASAGNGALWAVTSYRDPGGACGDGVDVLSSADGGYLWAYEYRINDCSVPWFYHYGNASIAVDISNDRVYVAAERNDTSLVVVYGDPVGGWGSSTLSASGGAESHPDVVIENDQGGSNRVYVAVVWNIAEGDNIGLYYSEDDGGLWTFQTVAGDMDLVSRDQPTAAYANGWLWIAYRYNGADIFFANSDVTLGSPFIITGDIVAADCSSSGAVCQWPDVAVVRDGSLGAIVFEYTLSAFDIDIYGVGSVSNGANWSPPIAFATTGSSETAPALTVDFMTSSSNAVTGDFHVVFVEGGGVYHRTIDSQTIAFGPLVQVSDSPRVLTGDSGYRTAATTHLRGGAWFPVIGMVEPSAFDYVLATTPGWTSGFYTNPPAIGLNLVVDGMTVGTPFAASWPSNTTHQINVTSPQLETPGSDRYIFDAWDSGNLQGHPWTAPDTGDLAETASFIHQWWATVDTDPGGLDVTVDGSTYTAPWSMWWNDSEPHTVDAPATQLGAPGERFLWNNWTDGQSQAHSVNATAAITITGRFIHELQLDLDSAPTGFGGLTVDSVVTGPATVWWPMGETHTIEANASWVITANERRPFVNWSDGSSGPIRNYTVADIVVGGPETLTANYPVTEYRVTVATEPAGLDVQIDGAWAMSPQDLWWAAGSNHSLAVNASQSTWNFAFWKDDVTAPAARNVTVLGPMTITANHTYVPLPLTVTANGTPASGEAPLTVDFTATAVGGDPPYTFSWEFGDGTVVNGSTPSHTYAAAGTYQANVTVTDGGTNASTSSVTVTVTAAPLVLDHCTVTPGPTAVAEGATQAFVARGYTGGNVELPGTTATWSVSGAIGTVSSGGLFTGGTVPGSGTLTGAVTANVTHSGVTRSCFASVTLTTAVNGGTISEPPWLVIGLILILVIALVVFLLLWMRRKKPAEAPAPVLGEETAPTGHSQGGTVGPGGDSRASLLKRLRDARDQNVMTEDEYQAARDALLGKL